MEEDILDACIKLIQGFKIFIYGFDNLDFKPVICFYKFDTIWGYETKPVL